MNYKDLLSRTLFILSSPAKAWEQISTEGESKSVLANFVYPMIGLCGVSEFIGTFFGKEFIPDVFQVALTHCCAVAVALFGGFFLSVYLLDKILQKWFSTTVSRDMVTVFVAYSMTVKFVLDILSSLLSLKLLLIILQIYTLFVVFEGTRGFLRLREDKVTLFTLVATIIILLCPSFIEIVFNVLSATLR
ncbi:DUF1282 family protein [Bacteroides caecigallinarum]|uniref:YIP1 family protein n=1 Tax=Bacteroides TaxID=816 RepID=UPI000820A9B1|nr:MULTISPECIES: YIP1 family protein [Bacteroides]MBM6959937.1 DUF1282 family protein [Bacteroides caecigallinarum]MCU6770662.1 YIP1 family protein [Bacteroides cellulolyticus]SCH23349.1 Protein of uncharacterised function (DUF1282) [uncultured Bacteroides sp.]